MKIILSRKGFDSGYGGYPSPIMPDGEMVSLPIPDMKKELTYDALSTNQWLDYRSLMASLFGDELKYESKGKMLIDDVGCHFDPDINQWAYARKEGWRGIFGQASGARSHLKNQGVTVGDLFLFFGWFRQTERIDGQLSYSKSDPGGRHMIYGYLEVGDIQQINKMTAKPWMLKHPHVLRGKTAEDSDYLYIAKEHSDFIKGAPGYGMFRYSEDVVLTKEGYSRSRWDLPEFFKDTNISYHSINSWKEGYFQSAAKGQEFVIEATEAIINWARGLIESNRINGLKNAKSID